MNVPYKVLARFYNNLIEDEGYKSYVNYVLGLVKKHAKTNAGIDTACGSGVVTRALKKHGFAVTGVDISEEMLFEAREISIKERLNIEYLKQDIRSLKSFNKVGFITCINDGLNYIPSADVLKTFKSFSKCLVKGGLLVFDISTESKMKNVLNGQMYGDNGEDLSFMWLSEYSESDKKLSISLTFFEKCGEVYKRYDEEQVQYAHSVEFIKEQLKTAGFTLVLVSNESGLPLKSDSQRAVFTAIKE